MGVAVGLLVGVGVGVLVDEAPETTRSSKENVTGVLDTEPFAYTRKPTLPADWSAAVLSEPVTVHALGSGAPFGHTFARSVVVPPEVTVSTLPLSTAPAAWVNPARVPPSATIVSLVPTCLVNQTVTSPVAG